MSLPMFPLSIDAHVIAWGVVAALGALLNYGAVVYWYLSETGARRDFRRVKPAFDVLPALIVGGVVTWVLMQHRLHHLLPGMWMALFGVANLASQRVLPRMINLVGWFYVACGVVLLVAPLPFTNPWPMAIVFCCGEWAGGFVLHFDRRPNASPIQLLSEFLFTDKRGREQL